MGVSGSGKTTIGSALAAELGWEFADGDDLHPKANVEKMARGVPLDDADRMPWLQAVHDLILSMQENGQSVVVACSALKQDYRNVLNAGTHIRWVYLHGSQALIRERMLSRTDHFMKSTLLNSQLQTLEAPRDALLVDISPPAEEIIATIRRALGL